MKVKCVWMKLKNNFCENVLILNKNIYMTNFKFYQLERDHSVVKLSSTQSDNTHWRSISCGMKRMS